MLKKFVQFALQKRFLIIGLSVLLVAGGIWAYNELEIEAYPDVSDTEVIVVTQYPGRAAEEVEQQVTLPIERVLNSVPHVIMRRSKTIFGLSVITLTFDDKVDVYFARQVVFQRLKDADVPDGVEPEIGPTPTPVGEIYRYVLTAPPQISSMQLRTLQDWEITPKLLQVPGVEDVVTFGGLVKQYHIIVNPQKLQDAGLTLNQFMDIIKNNNINTGGNVLLRGDQSIAIRGLGTVQSKSDIENIVLLSRQGVPLLVKDVADVDIGAMPPLGILSYTIPNERISNLRAVQGLVLMRKKENPSQVLKKIESKVAEINSQLTNGIQIKPILDRSDLVHDTIHTVSRTLLEGIFIVVLVLFFFLGNIRAALITAITIPLSLLFAFILMYFTGISANLLSLGAIDFGIIVDGSVIMVENIMYRLKHQTSGEMLGNNRFGIIQDAAHEVERQIFFSVTIIILAYLPLFTLQRVEGRLFSPMAYTLAFAILGSLILALTLIPVIFSFVAKKEIKEWENPVAKFINKTYGKILPFILNHKLAVIFSSAGLLIIIFYVASRLGTEFLPNLDEGSINIRTQLATGINIQAASDIANSMSDDLTEFPEIKAIVNQTGRNEDGTDPYGPNRIETLITLKPYNTWKSGLTKDELTEKIRNKLETRYPGAIFTFSQPIMDNVSEAVTGSVADLAIIVSGTNQDTLRSICDSIVTLVKPIRGASETAVEQEGPQSQLIIKIDRLKAARYGIQVGDIQTIVNAALGGKTVSQAYEGDKRFDIVVRYPIELRSTVGDIGAIIITTPNGERIPLNNLADIYFADGATLIARQNGERIVSVRTDIVGRDQGGFVKEAQKIIARKITLPRGYNIKWGGQFENLSRASKRLSIVMPITIIIIFSILFLLFKKVKYSLIVLSNVLFAFVGGILALYFRNMNFNVSAGVGFVSLFGVSVMSGVLLISKINQLRFEKGFELREAIIEGAKTQLRPIMMMMTVALIGLIPAAMNTGVGSDVQRPLATVIVGGLATALILTLIVLPGFYALVEGHKSKGMAKKEGD